MTEGNDVVTIRTTKKTKLRLDEIKIIPRETYDEVINRLVDKYQEKK